MKLYLKYALSRYFKLIFLLGCFSVLGWCLPISMQSRTSSFYGLGIIPKVNSRGITRCGSLHDLVAVDLLTPDDGARTLAEHPTFYWYIERKLPVSNNQDTKQSSTAVFDINFILRENVSANKNAIFRYSSTRNKLNASGGLYKFTLPSDSPSLQIGETYIWQIRYIDNTSDYEGTPVNTIGYVKRENNPAVMNLITLASTNLDKARIYAQNAYWYDALDEYTKWIDANPNDVKALSERLKMLDEIIDRHEKIKCITKYNAIDSSVNMQKVIPLIINKQAK